MIRHRKDLSLLYVAHIGHGLHEDIVAKCMAVISANFTNREQEQ